MRLVMLTEQKGRQVLFGCHVSGENQLLFQEIFEEEFLLDPDRHGREERGGASGGERQIGFKQAFEFYEGLVIEDDVANVLEANAGLGQTIADRMLRKARVMFFSGEALFKGSGKNLAVADEAGGTVMIVGGDAEDVGHRCR